MAFDGAIDDVIAQIGNAGDGGGDFDAIIQCGHPPAIGASA